ncbi:hypothetical protein TNCT_641451 [Trichonephila clavata]|uniref:Uncharacterized protein n=1 Tax=Trichonephila clavata TaxID=2740835 RepID=A0A8X6H678_TRICU|nr:hypothetical protein TNCT_641451 [Trichonephila clavata]
MTEFSIDRFNANSYLARLEDVKVLMERNCRSNISSIRKTPIESDPPKPSFNSLRNKKIIKLGELELLSIEKGRRQLLAGLEDKITFILIQRHMSLDHI